MMFFFFQAEDGIRDVAVTGVQTCALPIYLNHSVPYRRNAQRPLPPVRLRNVPAPHRLRPILPGLEIVLDTQQKRLDPLLLNGGDRLAIHPRSPAIVPDPSPRFPQDVPPVDPVVQRVEAALPTPLGRPPQRSLEFSHFALWVVGACAHALALTKSEEHTSELQSRLHLVCRLLLEK